MEHDLGEQIPHILACSQCGNDVAVYSTDVLCTHCGMTYDFTESGMLDMRLKEPKSYDLCFTLGLDFTLHSRCDFTPLCPSSHPHVDYSDIDIPSNLSYDLLSYFPKANSIRSMALDLGCGAAVHKVVCEHAGFEWVGLDSDPSSNALILGDAHSLPFKSETFEFILSVAVLEHIQFPFIMMKEVYRVLKPGGTFIGTVAFLEPFHGDSFYHHTHLGTLNSLHYGGFMIERISPSVDWSVLRAQAGMGLFPKMPTPLARFIIYPIQLLHKFWWWSGSTLSTNMNKNRRIRNLTGAFSFIVRKETPGQESVGEMA